MQAIFFKPPNQQVTNITKAILFKTVNCIMANPFKSIRHVTGGTIFVNLHFTGTKWAEGSQPLWPWFENSSPESWSLNTKNAPNASTAGKYHQIKAEIIIEHLWNPDERHRWERERWGDVRLQIFPTSLWEDLEKRKRKRETGEECTAQFRIR